MENSIGEIKDAISGSVSIKSVKYYKNSLTKEVTLSGISDPEFRFIPGRAFLLILNAPPTIDPDYTTLTMLADSFILECFSPEIEKRDIKPG